MREQWTAQDADGFGRSVCESTPEAKRARWAADLLELCSIICQPIPAVESVVAIGQKPYRWDWYDAGDAFHAVRAHTLAQEHARKPDQSLALLLCVAELVAKVIANAGGHMFDQDSGWWIAPSLRALVLEAKDSALEERIWRRLIADMVGRGR